MNMNRRPPRAVSPCRLRPILRPVLHPHPSPPPAIPKSKSKPPTMPKLPIPPIEHRWSTSDLIDIMKELQSRNGDDDLVLALASPPVFERGRFYQLYSALRDERLRKKQDKIAAETTVLETVELANKKIAEKASVGVKKSVATRRSPSNSTKRAPSKSVDVAGKRVATGSMRNILN